MKKKLSIVVIAVLLVTLVASLAGCYSTVGAFKYTIEADNAVLKGYNDTTTSTKVVIPDEIEGKPLVALKDYALVNTQYVKEIVIGKNISEITAFSINNNQALETFTVVEENPYFKSVDGVIYTKDGKELVSKPIRNGVAKYESKNEKGEVKKDARGNIVYDEYCKEFVIPDGVEKIRDNAFYHNLIQKIVMSDSVKYIGECAFLRVGYLEEVVFSKNLEYIGKDAFSKNSGLTTVTIHENIKEIQSFAFFDCENLKTVNIKKAEADIILGKKWHPTKLGNKIKNIKYNWNYVEPPAEEPAK